MMYFLDILDREMKYKKVKKKEDRRETENKLRGGGWTEDIEEAE